MPGRSTSTVSVALATFNSSRFIEPQLRSILEQSHPVHEVVVADDGSTDDTVALILRIAAQVGAADRVRVVATESVGGGVANFERAIRACTGDYVALADHDDVWHSNRVEAAVGVLDTTGGVSLVFSDAFLIDGAGARTGQTLHQAYSVTPAEIAAVNNGDALDVLVRRNIVTGATVMFRRSLAAQALPVPPRWVHDDWLAVIAASVGEVVFVPEPLIDYRVHGDNQIGVPSRSAWRRTYGVLRSGNSRLWFLRHRLEDLATTLSGLDAPVASRARVNAKLEFEKERTLYHPLPIVRGRRIWRLWRSGGYDAQTHQPRYEAWCDLFQCP